MCDQSAAAATEAARPTLAREVEGLVLRSVVRNRQHRVIAASSRYCALIAIASPTAPARWPDTRSRWAMRVPERQLWPPFDSRGEAPWLAVESRLRRGAERQDQETSTVGSTCSARPSRLRRSRPASTHHVFVLFGGGESSPSRLRSISAMSASAIAMPGVRSSCSSTRSGSIANPRRLQVLVAPMRGHARRGGDRRPPPRARASASTCVANFAP